MFAQAISNSKAATMKSVKSWALAAGQIAAL
jgi:hypothetical protein